jgi:hypothetical protein
MASESVDGTAGSTAHQVEGSRETADHDETRISSSSDDESTKSKHRAGKNGIFATICLLTNEALGAGILNFPRAYMTAGNLWLALFLQLVRTCSETTHFCSSKIAY